MLMANDDFKKIILICLRTKKKAISSKKLTNAVKSKDCLDRDIERNMMSNQPRLIDCVDQDNQEATI